MRSRAGVLTLSAAFLAVSTAAFAQSTGADAFSAYVERLEALGIKISNGTVDYNAGTLTVSDMVMELEGEIEGVSLEGADVSGGSGTDSADPSEVTDISYSLTFSAGTQTIEGFAAEDDVFSSDRWIYSDDTQFDISISAEGEGHLKLDTRLAGAEISNYTFTIPELPEEDAERQVSRWLPFLRSLLLASYDDATVPSTGATFEAYEVEDGQELLVMSGTLQMNGYRISGAKDGKIGSYEIDEITQSFLTRDAASDSMLSQSTKQARSVYEDIDAAAILDLIDPDVPETDQPRTLIGSGTTGPYESTQEIAPGVAFTISVGNSSLEDVTVTKKDNSVLALFDQILSDQTPAPEDLISDIFQVYRSFGVADARASGIGIEFPNLDDLQSGATIKIDIEEIAATGLDAGGIGELMVVGLNAPDLPDDASVKLDWAAIGDIEFAEYEPMRSMISTLMADPNYGEQNPIEVARAFLPRSFGYELEGLDLSLPETGRTQIGKSEFRISTTVPPIPTSIYAKNEDITVPVSALDDAEAQAFLTDLGIDEIVWSDETQLYWDEATKDLRLDRLMVTIKDLGAAEASIRFANVPKELFEDPQGQGQMAAILAQFVDARIEFIDDGLTGKALQFAAKDAGVSEDVIKAVAVDEALKATEMLNNPDFADMLETALKTFLDNPGTFTVTLSPENPVPLAQILGSLAAPQTLPDLLNIDIVAE
ncbi:hypothetical protein E1180_08365 [Roseibium denhamense]|nr:hypothetical protein [Roseibium denhamense]MTI05529.1 hypothetical protein [Roseibium denhamense]